MTKQRLYQTFDETTGGSAATERESSRRRARTKARTAAETAHKAAESAGQTIRAGAQEMQDRSRELGREAEVWAEEARERESAEVRAHEQAVERIARGDFERPRTEKVEAAGRKIGRFVGRVRSVEAKDIVTDVKGFVREHPNSIFGALAAGFVVGRLLRR